MCCGDLPLRAATVNPAIREAQRRYPDAVDWLDSWWQVAKLARWQSLHDVRVTYPATDQVEDCLVFNATETRVVGTRLNAVAPTVAGTLGGQKAPLTGGLCMIE